MQATVFRFDPDVHTGSVLTDDGHVVPFSAAAFATAGLRHLRVGQRLTVETVSGATPGATPEVVAMHLETIGRR